jgi:hypothetical protein
VFISSLSNESFSLSVGGNVKISGELNANITNIQQTLNVSGNFTVGNTQTSNAFIQQQNNNKLNVIGNAFCNKNVNVLSNPANIKNVNIKHSAYPINIPVFVDNQTISINYLSKHKFYYVDIGGANSSINQNFVCSLENANHLFEKNKIHHITLNIDYDNIVPSPTYNLYYCNKLNILGSQYNILFTGGNPTISNNTKNIIQNIEIVVYQNSIWKVISTITKYF